MVKMLVTYPRKIKDLFVNSSYIFYIIILLALIDQLTKLFFISYLKQQIGWKLEITSFFDIVFVWNYGVSFGLFGNYHQYGNMILTIANSLIVIYLLYVLLQLKSKIAAAGYGCIIGGAIGNIIDRCTHGAVFDFIYLHYYDYGFPIFNLADSFIFIGIIIVTYDQHKIKKDIEEKPKQIYDVVETKNIVH